jgi:hypothetical protein
VAVKTIPISEVRQKLKNILAALPHLSAAQIYGPLSYYYDHRPEMDRLIEESRRLKVEKVAEGVAVVCDETGR